MNQPTSPEVVVLCSDLFFSSSIEGTASQHDVPCRVVGSVDQLTEVLASGAVRRVIVDLEFPSLNPVSIVDLLPESPGPVTVGFGPHVKVDQLKAAREAGFDHVMPRSQFSEQLAAILSGNL
ncbi:MAG: hypothetical protein ACYTGL_06425 [Planctomycetota bacterium]|jgi:hypothetical protein